MTYHAREKCVAVTSSSILDFHTVWLDSIDPWDIDWVANVVSLRSDEVCELDPTTISRPGRTNRGFRTRLSRRVSGCGCRRCTNSIRLHRIWDGSAASLGCFLLTGRSDFLLPRSRAQGRTFLACVVMQKLLPHGDRSRVAGPRLGSSNGSFKPSLGSPSSKWPCQRN